MQEREVLMQGQQPFSAGCTEPAQQALETNKLVLQLVAGVGSQADRHLALTRLL